MLLFIYIEFQVLKELILELLNQLELVLVVDDISHYVDCLSEVADWLDFVEEEIGIFDFFSEVLTAGVEQFCLMLHIYKSAAIGVNLVLNMLHLMLESVLLLLHSSLKEQVHFGSSFLILLVQV